MSPRDASGNYALPPSNPVVSDTDITTTWANTSLADVGAEIEDSLSRSGKGGMLVPFLNSDGTVAAPGVSFTNETNTGWFRNAAGDLRAAILGVYRAAINAAGMVLPGNLAVTGTSAFTGAATFTAAITVNGGIANLLRSSLPAVGEDIGAGGSFGGNSVTEVDFSDEITLPTASGRPIQITVQPGNASSANQIYLSSDATPRTGFVYLYRKIGAGVYGAIAAYGVTAVASQTIPVSIGTFIDAPGAGAISYKLRYKVSNTAAVMANEGMVLAAFEL